MSTLVGVPRQIKKDLPVECQFLDQLAAEHKFPLPKEELENDRSCLAALSSLHHEFLDSASRIFQSSRTGGPWITTFIESDLAKEPELVPTAQALENLVITGRMDQNHVWAGALQFFWQARHNWSPALCSTLTESDRDSLDSEVHETDRQVRLQQQLSSYARYLRWRALMYDQVARLILAAESEQFVSEDNYKAALQNARFVDGLTLNYLRKTGGRDLSIASGLYALVGKQLQRAASTKSRSRPIPDGHRLLFVSPCDQPLPKCMEGYNVSGLFNGF